MKRITKQQTTRRSRMQPLAALALLSLGGCFEARDVCAAGQQLRCNGDVVQRCNTAASGWVEERRCAAGERCAAGACVPATAADAAVDAGPLCEPVLGEPFDDPGLRAWEPGSLVLRHDDPDLRATPEVHEGRYVAPAGAGQGGGHHRGLVEPVELLFQIVMRAQANAEVPSSQAAVGLFVSPEWEPTDGGEAGPGYVCAWFPHETRVEVRAMPEARLVAVAPVPPERATSAPQIVVCAHLPDGRWGLEFDGEPLALEVNEPHGDFAPLTVVSTYLSAASEGQAIEELSVLPCP